MATRLTLLIAALLLLAACTAQGALFPYEVVWVKPHEALTAAFRPREGWTGADGAYSVPLSSTRALWLFGDTFIGRVAADGHREKAAFIHSSAAWRTDGGFEFFWRGSLDRPEDLLSPAPSVGDKSYYWLGPAALVDNRLYQFAMVVVDTGEGPPGFQFKVPRVELLRIENPHAPPPEWRIGGRMVMPSPGGARCGLASIVEPPFLYAVAARDPDAPTRAASLCRVPLTLLSRMRASDWRFLCADGQWRSQPECPLVPLFDQAGAEMSITQVPGLSGWFAVYTPRGLGPDVALRWASRLEGPWSAPRVVYRAPERANPNWFQYGAKAHPELTDVPGRLVVTYNVNATSLGELGRNAASYAPRAIVVQLLWR